MEAGRDLDAKVARLMGHENIVWQSGTMTMEVDGLVLHGAPIPNYSTDLTAAWPVVEKLELWVFPEEGLWYAGVIDSRGAYVNTESGIMDFHFERLESADTAPLAICRAALASLG